MLSAVWFPSVFNWQVQWRFGIAPFDESRKFRLPITYVPLMCTEFPLKWRAKLEIFSSGTYKVKLVPREEKEIIFLSNPITIIKDIRCFRKWINFKTFANNVCRWSLRNKFKVAFFMSYLFYHSFTSYSIMIIQSLWRKLNNDHSSPLL